MLNVYFETYGCTANYNSTEIMKGLVTQTGLNVTNNAEIADLIVLNSCVVKEPTEESVRRRMSDFLKKNKKVILAGCMPRLKKEHLNKKKLYLLDTSHVRDLPNLIQDIFNGTYDADVYLKPRNEVKAGLPKISKEKLIGITQISEGCLGECAYCLTRFAKGKLFSYPKEKIIQSVQQDLQAGCKEIWLTSQDCAAYGNEEGKYLLPELLKKILSLEGRFLLRVGMMNPNNILKLLPALLEIYKDEKMYKFLHFPIQSGSDKILKSMKRRYQKKEILKIIRLFRTEFPEMHLSTDIIVGYPGEIEEDFKETLEVVRAINPETLNVTRFWPRPGTPAAGLKQVPLEKMKKRTIALAKLHKEICNQNQKIFLGKEFRVLINQKGFGNTYLGRDNNYKLFAVHSREKILGKKVKVKIKQVTPHYLISEVIK